MGPLIPSLLRGIAAVYLTTVLVCALPDVTLCGQYQNVTDPSNTYTRKSLPAYVLLAPRVCSFNIFDRLIATSQSTPTYGVAMQAAHLAFTSRITQPPCPQHGLGHRTKRSSTHFPTSITTQFSAILFRCRTCPRSMSKCHGQ
jgi:hypothetical protein